MGGSLHLGDGPAPWPHSTQPAPVAVCLALHQTSTQPVTVCSLSLPTRAAAHCGGGRERQLPGLPGCGRRRGPSGVCAGAAHADWRLAGPVHRRSGSSGGAPARRAHRPSPPAHAASCRSSRHCCHNPVHRPNGSARCARPSRLPGAGVALCAAPHAQRSACCPICAAAHGGAPARLQLAAQGVGRH